ncbi:MAG: polysaccharide biosynthesis/export family protein [Alphaproteobacteria bacterium]|nr:polysaccharide biosynthesis/export family protein [Alphaproteobacteria bacterium]
MAGRRRASMLLVLGAVAAGPAEYRIGPGDGLRVDVYDEGELSGEVDVSEGCTVSLPLVGEVPTCGLTATELATAITSAYADGYLVQPSVSVFVTRHRSQRVDVLGAVGKRGPLFLEGDTSVVEVISMAGGPSADNVVSVDVIRRDGTKEAYDLKKLMSSPERVLAQAGDRIVLRPGEVVYIEGQIKRAGTVTLHEAMTVTQVLASAGGPDLYANLKRVLVRRADGSRLRVNVLRVHRGVEEDIVLQPDDHIIIPRGIF